MNEGMKWLNYHHLLYFWTVAHEGSLAGAAEKLKVSQPSISAQIGALENALGEKLFRRAGRKKVLTETGRMVLGYADDIFALGQELVSSVQGRGGRVIRLQVGVVDSFPKLAANRILQPVFGLERPVHVMCREGKLEDLLGQLLTHRLDVVLADETVGGHFGARTYNHELGDSGVSICAAAGCAKRLRGGFPKSLNDAPALLPAPQTMLREALEKWFTKVGVRPRVIAEFEDLALMKAVAADGKGFIALPTVALKEARNQYGFTALGEAGRARQSFYAITGERRIMHPAVAEIIRGAEESLRA